MGSFSKLLPRMRDNGSENTGMSCESHDRFV